MYQGQRLTCAGRRRDMSPVKRCDDPSRTPQMPRRPIACNRTPCSAHRRYLSQQRYTTPRASTRAQTTFRRPETIFEDPESASFAPRSARPKSQTQRGWCQPLRQLHMTFPCFLIYFLVFFSVYWGYKYSWMQSHAMSDFSVNATDNMMRSGATKDDGQNISSENVSVGSNSKGSTDKDGITIDVVGSEGSDTEYGVSEGTDSQTNGSQIDDGGGTTDDGDQAIGIEVGSTEGSGRGVSKDGGKKEASESDGADSKNEYGHKHGVGENGSERSHEDSGVKKMGGLIDVYEDIDIIHDGGTQVSDKAGGLSVIVEHSGNKSGGERGVRQDVKGIDIARKGGGKLHAWDAIGFGARGYPGAAVVGGSQDGGQGLGVDRKVVIGLGGSRAQGDSHGQGGGGSKVIDGKVVGEYETEVQVATGSVSSVGSEYRGRLIDVSESGVKTGSEVSDSKRVLGLGEYKVGGHLVNSKGGDIESDMEKGGGEDDDGGKDGKGHINDDADSQDRSWEYDDDQLAGRQGSNNLTTKEPAVEHCLSFGANWSRCWLKWAAAILAFCGLTIVIFCCMNFVCWFVYLIILLVIVTFYVLKYITKVI